MTKKMLVAILTLTFCACGGDSPSPVAPNVNPTPEPVASIPDGFKLVPVAWVCTEPSPEPSPRPTPSPTPPPTCEPGERPGDECYWNQAECRWVCIPPPTPPPPPPPSAGICHVSNKGEPGGNVNIVLSWKEGEDHASHLDAGKFCPPDHRGACSCEQAIADAKACGVPATGGFTCKIEGAR